ncbi:LysM peptidoglycan-binding domain-containing protein [Stenotrophomonas sp. ATCM1_4]|jgi:nucleoid-associated protein YgaU|uniref:LysM peptidoglycan-binding domain-containing protein n=1 Tax=unclassified Stenotrophomonas TaxID=196198 RepID=UPI001048BA46|nr:MULTISPECIES: LysM peptidoglycan-binding domain-containing protein [unclassified Stenotrophomonas]MBD9536912.1 LysM peptidoglycan-binding domain-containing protein [Stenotrophomonas sp. STM01]TDB29393.1 LysM peptidoglycan-binding domain-containing protein [Stenotrophomonas sp. ATCM1_4]
MLKHIRTVAAVALLTVTTYAVGVELNGSHPDTYVVKKGDTLWDISARFLKKPWLWPEIWQANPQVKNPHLIYPGDVLSLAYLDRVTAQPGPRQEAPINAVPLADVEPFLKNLNVVDSFKELPYVVGLEDSRLRATTGQQAYVLGLQGAQSGQRYMVVRPTVQYGQPKHSSDLNLRGDTTAGMGNLWKDYAATSDRDEFLGYELAKVNVGTLTQVGADATQASILRLEDSGREVRAGDRLVPVQANPYDLQFIPHAPASTLAPGQLRVLAVTDTFTSGGPRDVIAISGGARDGIDNGTVFSIWRSGRHVNDRVTGMPTSRKDDAFNAGGSRVSLPDEYAAHAMVFRTFDKVSYALIMEGTKPARVGYELKHPDAQ